MEQDASNGQPGTAGPGQLEGALRLMKVIRRLKDRLGIQALGGEPLDQLVRRLSRTRVPELRLEVQPYDPAWPLAFERERQRLQSALAREGLVEIQHIGSSAIPGLPGKNILDIAVAVHELPCTARQQQALEWLGYACYGPSPVAAEFTWFWRVEEAGPSFAVHVCSPTRAFTDLVHFRDFMREHPAEQRRYEELKRTLAGEPGQTWVEYNVLKLHLIFQLTTHANAWAAERGGGTRQSNP